VRIINEPTAAALAYGRSQEKKEGTILVYDLGGGTFDVSVLDVEIGAEGEERDAYHVLSTSGDTHLGGDDFDQRLIDYIADEFKKDTGIDLRKDRQALQRLREAAEKAKCELSTTLQTTISLPFITSVEGEGPKHLEMTITRAKLEELIDDLIHKTEIAVKDAMKEAGVAKGDLDEVILVGGSTRIPAVQELVKELTGKEPRKDINPDEVVACGAAIQAAAIKGETQDIVLMDVTPLSLGLETLGDVCDVVIPRNTNIPTQESRIYSTASDMQTTVEINVLQGERARASQNKSLGRFHLTGIPPAPRGVPQIEVAFDIDANGILHVSAQDKATGKEQDITITGSGQLSDDQVKQMVQEAREHEEEDKKFRELAETRNQADQVAYQLEKTLDEMGDKVPEGEASSIREKIEHLREVKDTDDVAVIRQAIDAANQEFAAVSERIYQQAGAEAQQAQQAQEAEGTTGGPAGGPTGADEDVIDAEFEAEEE